MLLPHRVLLIAAWIANGHCGRLFCVGCRFPHRADSILGRVGLSSMLALVMVFISLSAAGELSVEDFSFDGPFGCEGAEIKRIGPEHFEVVLGHAPEHTDWCNMLGFVIRDNAKGKKLRLDVNFFGGEAYRFNHYRRSSWSHDGVNWHSIAWEKGSRGPRVADTLLFPEFTEDVVYFGHQVPMSYENVAETMEKWGRHPHATVHVLGKSLEGRNLFRLEITDPESPHPEFARWCHYFANQHPGEHNSQWRMAGIIDWLLSDEATECRRRSICHFILLTSPDGPPHGWYRVNRQGVDMNRSYFVEGADAQKQAHEAYVVQKDLEALMASDAPVTDVWSMHTWGGIVEPLLLVGPEMGTVLEPWTKLRDLIEKHDSNGLVKPLKTQEQGGETTWHGGPHRQFGISAVLCEGGGDLYTKQENLDSGEALIKGITEYYAGTKPRVSEKNAPRKRAGDEPSTKPNSLVP